MAKLKMIVGLGNPGPKYIETRHNAGFWFIDAITNTPLTFQSRFKGLVGELTVSDQKVLLLKPETYMNKSGESVLALAHYYKILPHEILVAHDELDLPPGVVRLKSTGGVGGHNGLRDISAHLNTPNFHRLRIGIGHPGHASLVFDYVLKKAPSSEQDLLLDAIANARGYLTDLVHGQFESVMNQLHQKNKGN